VDLQTCRINDAIIIGEVVTQHFELIINNLGAIKNVIF